MDSQEKKHERVNQKRRTRAELLRAARELVEKGNYPSVAEVADHAGISRATAYRYFSAADEMIREAALDGAATKITIAPASPGDGIGAVETRIDTLVSDVFRMVQENEGVFRALLGGSATGQNQAPRGARRVAWLREALSPLENQLTTREMERLVHALSLMMGIESLVVMRDICELEPGEAENVLRWSARTLLAGALGEHASKAK